MSVQENTLLEGTQLSELTSDGRVWGALDFLGIEPVFLVSPALGGGFFISQLSKVRLW